MSDVTLKPCPFCGEAKNLSVSTDVVMPDDYHSGAVTCGNCNAVGRDGADLDGWLSNADEAKSAAITAWNTRPSNLKAIAGDGEVVASEVLGHDDDLHSVAHALDIGGIGTPYSAYQGSLYCAYQEHRIADFQDYGLALAASVLFNNAKAIKAALSAPVTQPAGDGEIADVGVTGDYARGLKKAAEIARFCQSQWEAGGNYAEAGAVGGVALTLEKAAPVTQPAGDGVRSLDEWSEEDGNVVWWALGEDGQWLAEPAYIGSPLDLGQTIEIELRSNQGEFIQQHQVGGWPGYHTHWTPHPQLPAPPAALKSPIGVEKGEAE